MCLNKTVFDQLVTKCLALDSKVTDCLDDFRVVSQKGAFATMRAMRAEQKFEFKNPVTGWFDKTNPYILICSQD